MQILPAYEAKQFDLPPKLNQAERKLFFTPTPAMKVRVNKAKDEMNRIGLILQYGYFRATGKFYVSSKFHQGDIHFVAKNKGYNLPMILRRHTQTKRETIINL